MQHTTKNLRTKNILRYICIPLFGVVFFSVCTAVFAAPKNPFDTPLQPKYTPEYKFPVLQQGRNTCYFTSIEIVVRATSQASIRLSKSMKAVGFDGSRLAYPSDQSAFEKLLHFSVVRNSQVKFLHTELSKGNPVLVSYLLKVGKKEYPHIAVAYSFDAKWVWVSDPYTASRKRIAWDAIFTKWSSTRYNVLRKPVFTPYAKWSKKWIEQEKVKDFWKNEELLKAQ